jgi:hypothetical protein
LFLDEIGDMPIDLQGLLLRILQEGEILPVGGRQPIKVDVRVVAATNVRLREAIAAGKLREDLYYRLNVLTIHLPPLRERDGDIEILATYCSSRGMVRPVGCSSATDCAPAASDTMGEPHARTRRALLPAVIEPAIAGQVTESNLGDQISGIKSRGSNLGDQISGIKSRGSNLGDQIPGIKSRESNLGGAPLRIPDQELLGQLDLVALQHAVQGGARNPERAGAGGVGGTGGAGSVSGATGGTGGTGGLGGAGGGTATGATGGVGGTTMGGTTTGGNGTGMGTGGNVTATGGAGGGATTGNASATLSQSNTNTSSDPNSSAGANSPAANNGSRISEKYSNNNTDKSASSMGSAGGTAAATSGGKATNINKQVSQSSGGALSPNDNGGKNIIKDSGTTTAGGGVGSSFNTASLTNNRVKQIAADASGSGAVTMTNAMGGQGILQANQNTGGNGGGLSGFSPTNSITTTH